MCINAKSSFLGWAVGTGVGLALWIRNDGFDRLFALFIIAFSLIQLFELFAHLGFNTNDVSLSIYIGLWLQVLVLGLGLYIYVPSLFSNVWALFAIAIFVFSVFTALRDVWGISVGPGGHLIWTRQGKNFMSPGAIWYVIGIFVPLFYLFYVTNYSLTIAILIIFGIISFIYSFINYHKTGELSTMWCYLAVGFAFLVYFMGLFTSCRIGP